MSIRHGLGRDSAPWGNAVDNDRLDFNRRLTTLEQGLSNLTNQMASGFQQIGGVLFDQTVPVYREAYRSVTVSGAPGADDVVVLVDSFVVPNGFTHVNVFFTNSITAMSAGSNSMYVVNYGMSVANGPDWVADPMVDTVSSDNSGVTFIDTSGGYQSLTVPGVIACPISDIGLVPGDTLYVGSRFGATDATAGTGTVSVEFNAAGIVVFSKEII